MREQIELTIKVKLVPQDQWMDEYHQLSTNDELIYKYVGDDCEDEDVHTKIVYMDPEDEERMYTLIGMYGKTYMKMKQPVIYYVIIDSRFLLDYEEAKAESMRKINLN